MAYNDHDIRAAQRRQANQERMRLYHEAEAKAAKYRDLAVTPLWEAYCQKIGQWIVDTERLISAAKDALADPSVVTHEELLQAKLNLARLQGQRQAWEDCIELPRALENEAHQLKGEAHVS